MLLTSSCCLLLRDRKVSFDDDDVYYYSRCTIGCLFRFWKKEAERPRDSKICWAHDDDLGHIKFDGTIISVLGIPSQYSAFQLPAYDCDNDVKSDNLSCNQCIFGGD